MQNYLPIVLALGSEHYSVFDMLHLVTVLVPVAGTCYRVESSSFHLKLGLSSWKLKGPQACEPGFWFETMPSRQYQSRWESLFWETRLSPMVNLMCLEYMSHG